jgi:hypothetical protein
MELFFQIVGWLGTFLIIFAYFSISSGRLNATSKKYQLLNLIGAIFVGLNVFHQNAWPAFTLQIVWAIIAIISLVKIKK